MRIPIPKNKIPDEGKGTWLLLEDGREVAVFTYKGTLYAIDNICPHEGGPLGEGSLDDTTVTCPWHGWQFDITTGQNQNLWNEGVQSYPIEMEGEQPFLIID